MSDLSLFLDESGSDNLRDTYYILALVLHDQADALADNIVRYELALRDKGLPDVPFHATPLLNGHDAYEGMDLAERKRLLSAFRVFFRHLPVRYGLVVLRTREYSTLADVEAAMRRKIADFLFDKLAYFHQERSHVPPRFGGRLSTLAGGRLHLHCRAHCTQV